MNLGLYRNHNNEVKIGLEVGAAFEMRFVKTVGVQKLWRQSITYANDLQPGASKESEADQYWEGAHGGECFGEFFDLGKKGEIVLNLGSGQKKKRCQYMKDAKTLVDNPPDFRCKQDMMEKKMNDKRWLKNNNDLAVMCIQHWHRVNDKVNKLIKKYHKKKNLQGMGTIQKSVFSLGYKLKVNEWHQKLKLNSAWIIAGIFAATGRQPWGAQPANANVFEALGIGDVGTGKISWGFGVDAKDYKMKAKMGPRFIFDHLGQFTNRWHFGSFSVYQIYQLIKLARARGGDARKRVKDNMMSGFSDVSGGFQAFASYAHTFELGPCLFDCVVADSSAAVVADSSAAVNATVNATLVIDSNETVRL